MVEIHPHGLFVRIYFVDHGGNVVEHGDGVQPLGQEPEPLPGDRVEPQEVVLPPGGGAGDDALLRGKVSASRSESQGPHLVAERVHEAPVGELL